MKLIIKSILTFAISLFLVMGMFSQDITGSWKGTLHVQGTDLEVVFHIDQENSGYSSLMDSPTQGAFDIPTSKTTFINEQLEIVITNLAVFYQGKLKNDTISGTFNQGGMPFPLVLARTQKRELIRPQEPKPPYPYEVEEITFMNSKEKIELSATLTIPKGVEKSPAVVLIAGSGPNDRDETIFGHKPFLVLADYLTRQGIAVLRYDKRGVGKSQGEYSIATTQDFAEDTEAAFNYLKTRREIDSSNIGLIGHSEGGVIAPMVAVQNKDVKFVVLMAGVGVSGTELVLAQHQHAFDKTTLTPKEKKKLNQNLMEIYSNVLNWKEYVGSDEDRNLLKQELSMLWKNLAPEIRAEVKQDVFIKTTEANITIPWFRSFLKTNPLKYLEKLSLSVFAINGENDIQVSYQTNLKGIEQALKKADNSNFTIKSYPNLNHLFQESTTGEIDEYGKIEQTISPEVLSDITNWILEQVK